jgi:hypothetical protein
MKEAMLMKRHYFIGDDLNDIAMVEKDLLENGIAAEQIHVLCLNDADAEIRHLHDVQSLMKKDVIHSTEIGALLGLAASALAIAVAHLTGIAAKIGWVPFVFLAIVLLGFLTWEGGLIGIQTPNFHFRRFEKALRAGEHVFFVDAHEEQERIVQHIVAHHRMRPAGTGSSSPRWLVRLQANVRRFFEWAP